jgi:hypothetical protein
MKLAIVSHQAHERKHHRFPAVRQGRMQRSGDGSEVISPMNGFRPRNASMLPTLDFSVALGNLSTPRGVFIN